MTAPYITIPPAALEALRDELRISGLWADPATARVVCLAMLKAWPGMYPVNYGGDEPPFLVLPLPKENTDAEG